MRMALSPAISQRFDHDGVVMIEWALDAACLTALDAVFAELTRHGARARLRSGMECARAHIRAHPVLGLIAADLAGAPARLVRAIAFDKSPAANWFVPWHQDRSVALGARADVAGFEHWTIKDGLVHAEPPVAVLEAMVTLRVHLDDCTEDDGPLEVARGSHRQGRLEREAMGQVASAGETSLCLAARGDILAMRPLTVHRSQRAKRPTSRRVLHLEYTAQTLPPPLTWAMDEVMGAA
jgi:ectoine hydroxylase-related dioxygenase (phytanoyl-CoA dioxygenase family)